jgi:hypothetical protein
VRGCLHQQASFDQDKQLKFRAALAASAGTKAENVEITSISEGRRRQGQGIKVENKVPMSGEKRGSVVCVLCDDAAHRLRYLS